MKGEREGREGAKEAAKGRMRAGGRRHAPGVIPRRLADEGSREGN
jgi:hypothetical protein